MSSILILTIRSDQPEAELKLLKNENQLAAKTWQAHRQLAETIHIEILNLLKSQGKILNDVQAIGVFKGPGSFTGLRIGISVANALADGLGIPIVGTNGDNWVSRAVKDLRSGVNHQQVIPEYGTPPRTTQPKH
jgi:tRNA threonylcarbamoyladenosine biosynthesis protein TsaB